MLEHVRDILNYATVACLWAGCLMLHLKLGSGRSLLLLAALSVLVLVSTVGVWAIGWHNSRPFVDDAWHGFVLAFASSLPDLQRALLVISAVAFLMVSLAVKRSA